MNEDYLWNKTGEDAEIERLEKALQEFRYQETAPPALLAKVLSFRKKSTRRIIPLAVAASLAFVMISFGVWFSSNKSEIKNEIAQQNDVADKPLVKEQDEPPVEIIETPKKPVRRNLIKPKKAAIAFHKPKNKNAETTVNLTVEERYAYNQLMTALSITSSKLKMVKDRVEGVELAKAASSDRR